MSSSAFDLLFRTTDLSRWGVGLGRNLHNSEVDGNFWILAELIQDLQDNPASPNNIASMTVNGDNQLVITMQDASTFGPFDLPVASFTYRDNWTANTDYKKDDLFTQSTGLYLVLVDYHSAATFDSALPTIKRLVSYPVNFDIGFFFPAIPGTGIAASEPMFSYITNQPFFLPANLPTSNFILGVASTADLNLDLQKDGVSIGTLTFSAGDAVGAVTFTDDVQFVPGDIFDVITPGFLDATARNMRVNFAATKGEAEGPSSS